MFITLEGIEGSGKTTQAQKLSKFLTKNGYDHLLTREPGGTKIGGKIRTILLDNQNTEISGLCELLLYAADRSQHIEQKIKPALYSNKIVICDRFFDATTVYQGFARKLDISIIYQLHKIVLSGLQPDMTIIFDLPVELGLKRAWKRIKTNKDNENRFEQEKLKFHQKIRAGYLELAKKENKRFKIIDAAKHKNEVFDQMIETIILKFPNFYKKD